MSLLNPYCTLAQLKAELKISASDTSKDLVLEESINRASRWVDWYTNRTWYTLDYSATPLTLRAPNQSGCKIDGSKIYLPGPFFDLNEVAECGEVLVENEDFYLDHDSSVLVRVSDGVEIDWDFQPPENTVVLTGRIGYETSDSETPAATLPSNVNYATILVAAAFSGENRKQMQRADGTTEEVVLKKIPDIVYQVLGKSGVQGAGQVSF